MNANLNLIHAEFAEKADQLISFLLAYIPEDNHQSVSLYQKALGHYEERLILLTLQWANGNQVKASRRLGITRATLRKRMIQYGITKEMIKTDKNE